MGPAYALFRYLDPFSLATSQPGNLSLNPEPQQSVSPQLLAVLGRSGDIVSKGLACGFRVWVTYLKIQGGFARIGSS